MRFPYREVIEDTWGHGRRVAGIATSAFRSLPDFLVIGTQKGGTTSLFRYLEQHPNVANMLRKEIHYFDLNYSRGVKWYKGFFPLHETRRRHLKKTGQPLIAGEATPFYLYHPLIPGRVKSVIPEVRLIAVLRDPVERAYSHYHHLVRGRKETRPFREVVEIELRSIGEGLSASRAWSTYRTTSDIAGLGVVARGFYAQQLERWVAHFSRSQLLVIKSDDLFSRPGPAISQVHTFLNLDSYKIPDFPVHNRGEYCDNIDMETRDILESTYEPHNARLVDLMGVSF